MEVDSVNSVPVQNTPPPPDEVPVSQSEQVPPEQTTPEEPHIVDYFA